MTDAPTARWYRRLWRRSWVKVVVVGLGVFVMIQLVPYRVDNPPQRDEPAWDSPRTRSLAVRACYSCHSNETQILWFEHVAPVSWYITNHVKEGRSALNFSEWSTNPGEAARDAAEPLQEGSMPPAYFH